MRSVGVSPGRARRASREIANTIQSRVPAGLFPGALIETSLLAVNNHDISLYAENRSESNDSVAEHTTDD